MKHFHIGTYSILALFLLVAVTGAALPIQKETRTVVAQDNTKRQTRTRQNSPVNKNKSDSIPKDSISKDSVQLKKQALDAEVNYNAKDSIIFTEGNWAYLYGNAEVKYKDLGLKGENLTTNMDSSIVWAKYGVDSLGNEFGYPEFSQGKNDKYEAKSIKYNFKTKKGYITHVVTQQGEGYVVAEKAKKNDDGSFFMSDGKYTTCDDHEHPHFYLNLTKAKVRPKKDVVTGPAYLVVADVPLPLAIPFAFFPFTSKYSSGVIFPSYVDELERGFGLTDGGYYFAINDNVDLALTGDIYTKGSWGVKAESTYRKRYKYSGQFAGNYIVNKKGDKEVPASYSVSKDLSIRWSHSQDAKANAFRQLSANVNFETSSYNHNNLYSMLNSDYTSNAKSSSVSFTQTFPNSKWTISASMQIAQRSSDSTVNMTLPSLSINMSRTYPFKRKNAVGERWYEKIYMSYSGSFSNSISTKENKLFKSNLLKDWKNGAKHSIPIGATFNLFNYISISPSFNYDEQWHTHKIHETYDAVQKKVVPLDTTYGFYRTYNYSTSIGLQTKLYGMFTPLFGEKYVKKIRHVFTPSVSFSYAPDFSAKSFGFYDSYQYYDANGVLQTYYYTPYSGNVYSPPGIGKTGSLSLSLQNNLEMKVKSDKDSTGTKVVSLIDNFSVSSSYNMLVKEFRWSDISTNTRLKISKSLTLNINATFDPYTYQLNNARTGLEKVDVLRVRKTGALGRLKNTGYSFSESINQDTFKKWFGKGKDKSKDTEENKKKDLDKDLLKSKNDSIAGKKSLLNGKKKSEGTYDEDGYLKNEVKWNLSANYSFNYGYGSAFDPVKCEYKYKLTHNLGIGGRIQPTKNWDFSFNTSYNFDSNKFSYMTCNLTRDLHCFSLSASFTPIGPNKSYFVVLRVKSSMLQDLKYQQSNRSSSLDPVWP